MSDCKIGEKKMYGIENSFWSVLYEWLLLHWSGCPFIGLKEREYREIIGSKGRLLVLVEVLFFLSRLKYREQKKKKKK
jgi:hypothetical protein